MFWKIAAFLSVGVQVYTAFLVYRSRGSTVVSVGSAAVASVSNSVAVAGARAGLQLHEVEVQSFDTDRVCVSGRWYRVGGSYSVGRCVSAGRDGAVFVGKGGVVQWIGSFDFTVPRSLEEPAVSEPRVDFPVSARGSV